MPRSLSSPCPFLTLCDTKTPYGALPNLARAQRPCAGAGERGLGFWITDQGNLLPVPLDGSHSTIAPVYFEVLIPAWQDQFRQLAHRFSGDPLLIAQHLGWSRIRMYFDDGKATVYVDLGRLKGREHTSLALRALERIGLPLRRLCVATLERLGYVEETPTPEEEKTNE